AADKGRHCDVCSKNVIDFSAMSDHDIAQFFKKPSTGSVCGRFTTNQLDREIRVSKKRIPWLRYFFQILIPALLFSRASGQNIKPPKMDRVSGNDTIPVKAGQELKVLGMILPPKITPEVKIPDRLTVKGKPVIKEARKPGKRNGRKNS